MCNHRHRFVGDWQYALPDVQHFLGHFLWFSVKKGKYYYTWHRTDQPCFIKYFHSASFWSQVIIEILDFTNCLSCLHVTFSTRVKIFTYLPSRYYFWLLVKLEIHKFTKLGSCRWWFQAKLKLYLILVILAMFWSMLGNSSNG